MKAIRLFLFLTLLPNVLFAYTTVIKNDEVLNVEKNGDLFFKEKKICSLSELKLKIPIKFHSFRSHAVIGDNIYLFSTAGTLTTHRLFSGFIVNPSNQKCDVFLQRDFSVPAILDKYKHSLTMLPSFSSTLLTLPS